MAIYTINSYDRLMNAHRITGGGLFNVACDLFVASDFADFPEDRISSLEAYNAACESIVGKTVEIESLRAYSYIANGIKLISPSLNKQD